MPRMTRAQAAQVAEELHVDEDVVLEMSGIESGGVAVTDGTMHKAHAARKPLGEVTPNSSDKKSEGELSDVAGEDEQGHLQQNPATVAGKRVEKTAKQKKQVSIAVSPATVLDVLQRRAADVGIEDGPPQQDQPQSQDLAMNDKGQ